MTSLSAEIGVHLKSLKVLNKYLKKNLIYPSGSSICVYGSRKKKGNLGIEMIYGRRSDHLYEYQTIKGTDNCTTLFQHFESYEYFVAANPNIQCESLDIESSTIYLTNTIIENNVEESSVGGENSKKVRYGAWSSWSKCDNGRRSRYRHVYGSLSELSFVDSSVYEESEKCAPDVISTNALPLPNGGGCPGAYNGCSVPPGRLLYRLFTPACNVHDICYQCDISWYIRKPSDWNTWENRYYKIMFNRKGVGGQYYCDQIFLRQMKGQCRSYWHKWYHAYDRQVCYATAYRYYITVRIFGGLPIIREQPWEGCQWGPKSKKLNNAQGNGYKPDLDGCPCLEGSCKYL
eukprot:CAMPEP_0194282872 /NCGR_PEP_ID=MMETSP0169-20130528/24117_1 /TAXON_ID=218684 /ORGANISM="Corethron pennatum, Strain L29A3" /LENGTH=345 /DNA_ID=CAMNT_0039028329 /DNA_START=354 /DNA_END=1394 /DNA_ORIENTATION=+